jgi:hypothetical protein|tara:strand:- start:517 stop:774 length:258 start_codon:yes stop_codon:yes gene_type:complete
MKTIIVVTLAMLFSFAALAESEYAPSSNDRIILYKVTSDNENAPMYSGYYRDSDGKVHQVAVWSGRSDKYLEGPVTAMKEVASSE